MNLTFADILQLLTTIGLGIGVVIALRKAPSEIKVIEATAKSSDALTDKTIADTTAAQNKTIGDQNATIAGMLATQSTMVDQISELNHRLGEALGLIRVLTDDNVQLRADVKSAIGRAEKSDARAEASEAKFTELEARTQDYPHRLELAEVEIATLKARIAQQNVSAARVSETSHIDAQARKSSADAALIAVGGLPVPDAPHQPPDNSDDDDDPEPTPPAAALLPPKDEADEDAA